MKWWNVIYCTISWERPPYCCLCRESMIKYARKWYPMAHCEYSCVCLWVNVSVHMVVGGIQAGVSLRRSLDGDTSALMMSLYTLTRIIVVRIATAFTVSVSSPAKCPLGWRGALSERPSCPFLFLNLFIFPFLSFLYWRIRQLIYSHTLIHF